MLPFTQPKATLAEMTLEREFARRWMTNYSRTILIVTPDQQAFLHNLPRLKLAAAGETATLHLWPIILYVLRSGSLPDTESSTLRGQWGNANGEYQLSFANNGKPDTLKVQLKDDRLTMTTADGDTLVFDRED